MSTTKKDVTSTMSALTIDPKKTLPAKTKKPKVKKPVADSWEDEDLSSPSASDDDDEDDATPTDMAPSSMSANKGTSAPPPTPISPTYNTSKGVNRQWSSASAAMDAFDEEQLHEAGEAAAPRRPEKTDAVARRMIAGALGIKAPKPTEEQKAYDRAVREQERKRREEEKAAERKRQEEAEKAKAAIWDE